MKYLLLTFATALVLTLTGCQTGTAPGGAPSSSDRSAYPATPPSLDEIQGEEKAVLTYAPNVPPPITRDYPTKVIVEMEVIERDLELAPGVQYTFWTFGGQVPGQFIRVRQGDLVEFHLKNHPDSKVPHNIDLHSVTGPGGGAESSFTAPGQSTQFSFQALNSGLFIYHCATAPVGMHIANGMYGLILVEPPEGLPPVDREFYVLQSEFYTAGEYGAAGLQPFSMEKALQENPDYVVFNGSVGAMSGDNAVEAKVGETVRLFVGNGGPNLVSSFHVIGEIFDTVYLEGGTALNHNVQTTLIPAGGAVITEFKLEVPGPLILVDHSIFRAFNKGAIATIEVTGDENELVFSGQQAQAVYHGEGSVIQGMPAASVPATPKATNKEERMDMGRVLYQRNCLACHQADGQGVPKAFPPLASSDYIKSPEDVVVPIIHGLSGEIVVNGETYNSVMPKLRLSDEEVANIATYVLNTWENVGGEVTPEQVDALR